MDIFPAQPRPSKRVRLEKEERKFSGGMRNPALALRRLAGLKEAGKDVSRMWNNLVTDKPEALEVAALYWTRASSRNGATGWSNYGGLKVMPKWTCGASICLRRPCNLSSGRPGESSAGTRNPAWQNGRKTEPRLACHRGQRDWLAELRLFGRQP